MNKHALNLSLINHQLFCRNGFQIVLSLADRLGFLPGFLWGWWAKRVSHLPATHPPALPMPEQLCNSSYHLSGWGQIARTENQEVVIRQVSFALRARWDPGSSAFTPLKGEENYRMESRRGKIWAAPSPSVCLKLRSCSAADSLCSPHPVETDKWVV